MSVPTRAILIYKAPELGCVKTRLAKSVGDRAALELYRWMGIRQLNVIPAEWEVETRFSPDGHESMMREWLGSRMLMRPQGEGDLGDRMMRAARSCLEDGVERKVIFLGADCLGLDEPALQKAALALDRSDFVLGPASDGGYYLLGIKSFESSIFHGMNWGSPSVLKQTIDRIRLLDKAVKLLEQRVDVDDWKDLLSQRTFVDPDLWERLSLPDT